MSSSTLLTRSSSKEFHALSTLLSSSSSSSSAQQKKNVTTMMLTQSGGHSRKALADMTNKENSSNLSSSSGKIATATKHSASKPALSSSSSRIKAAPTQSSLAARKATTTTTTATTQKPQKPVRLAKRTARSQQPASSLQKSSSSSSVAGVDGARSNKKKATTTKEAKHARSELKSLLGSLRLSKVLGSHKEQQQRQRQQQSHGDDDNDDDKEEDAGQKKATTTIMTKKKRSRQKEEKEATKRKARKSTSLGKKVILNGDEEEGSEQQETEEEEEGSKASSASSSTRSSIHEDEDIIGALLERKYNSLSSTSSSSRSSYGSYESEEDQDEEAKDKEEEAMDVHVERNGSKFYVDVHRRQQRQQQKSDSSDALLRDLSELVRECTLEEKTQPIRRNEKMEEAETKAVIVIDDETEEEKEEEATELKVKEGEELEEEENEEDDDDCILEGEHCIEGTDEEVFHCLRHVDDIMDYLFERETVNRPKANYMDLQKDINARMRGELIDWYIAFLFPFIYLFFVTFFSCYFSYILPFSLFKKKTLSSHLHSRMVNVCQQLTILPETTFLAVHLLDTFLSRKQVALSKLQLVGVTALFIASKFEDQDCPLVDDWVYISANSFARKDLVRAEKALLTTLDWDLSYPSPLDFLRRFSKAARSDSRVHSLAKYLVELSLPIYAMLQWRPSQVAAASVYLARAMTRACDGVEVEEPLWPKRLVHHSRWTEEEILPCVRVINTYLFPPYIKKSCFNSIRAKYNQAYLFRVASIPPVIL
ncbi:G2/mitotic-specific cyclin [Balamuthia mandrillaris]